ncbi:MAG: hypothetical protein BGO93_18995 [Mesorhizobium sp. 65-26]|nr:MAG: hypothetical protein BGO93_18995 [Mesorhizobium sp. 65-26]
MKDRLRTTATCLAIMVGEVGYSVILLQPSHKLPIAGRAYTATSKPTRDLAYMGQCPVGALAVDESRSVGAIRLLR